MTAYFSKSAFLFKKKIYTHIKFSVRITSIFADFKESSSYFFLNKYRHRNIFANNVLANFLILSATLSWSIFPFGGVGNDRVFLLFSLFSPGYQGIFMSIRWASLLYSVTTVTRALRLSWPNGLQKNGNTFQECWLWAN